MQVDNCTQWRTQDFFKGGGGFKGGGVSNIALHAMIDLMPGLKKLMSFPSSKFLGKFSRNGVGVSIVHHQLSDKHRSSDPKGPGGGGGVYPSITQPPPPPPPFKPPTPAYAPDCTLFIPEVEPSCGCR